MKNKKIIIIILSILLLLIVMILTGFLILKEDGIEIDENNFPEETLREVAINADKNKNGILSKKEISKVKKVYLKKLAYQGLADVLEVANLPVYTNADFTFNFEGIQYFTSATSLTIDLGDGEFFNKESDEEQIYVETTNLEKIYELTNVKSLHLREVEFDNIDIDKFPKLKKLYLSIMYNMKELVFEKHNALEYIWLGRNDMLRKVDVSNIENLNFLQIDGSNSINEIIFGPNNSQVEEFRMDFINNIDYIDLSDLVNLKTLYIRDSSIKNLDLSNNVNIEKLGLYYLNLDSLDLTNNLKLKELINDHDSFKTVKINDNNMLEWLRWIYSDIKEIPINNLNKETIIGLDIQGTNIKEFDIRPYPNLKTFYYDEDKTTIIGELNKNE